MSREEFMKELEYLLSDISAEDKAEAIEYYRDYLEEAGEENESEAIKGFGSPERIAAIIRSDLAGNLEDGGAFTENGYEDERFRDPNYQVAERYHLPDPAESRRPERHGKERGNPPKANQIAKFILWGILFVVASPILLGLGGGLFGIFSGILALLVAAVIGLGAITGALFICCIGLFICGIVMMVLHPINGVLIAGISIFMLGLAMACLALCGAFYGKFLPFLFRSTVDGIGSLLYGRRKHS